LFAVIVTFIYRIGKKIAVKYAVNKVAIHHQKAREGKDRTVGEETGIEATLYNRVMEVLA